MSKITDILPDDESNENRSPLLHSLSKENPFSVPIDYFDGLPSEIIQKCRENVEPKKWGQGILANLLAYKWRVLGMAGCVAAICFFAIHTNTTPVSYEAMAKSIPDSLIVAHLDKNIADLNVTILEDLQVPENNSKAVADSANTDQDIIAYLMNDNISVSDIVNEP